LLEEQLMKPSAAMTSAATITIPVLKLFMHFSPYRSFLE
jgi:hypothetical protein